MAKNSTKTRKRILKEFHSLLKAKRTDESNPSLQTQRRVLKNKMATAKKRALRQQKERIKNEELIRQMEEQAKTNPAIHPDLKMMKTLTGDSGSTIIVTEQLPSKESFSTLQQAYDHSSTFKEIIKHGF